MKTRKPNFLIIVAEQLRADCISINNNPDILTPNIDEIGGGGFNFTNAYSSCPLCLPARRSLLRGQFPSTHGALDNKENGKIGQCFDEPWNEKTFADVLREHGYHTCWVGRSMHQTPVRKRYGFDHMVLADHRLTPDDYDEFLMRNSIPPHDGYYSTGVMHNDWTARPWHHEEKLHSTNWTVQQALEFLSKRDPSVPFALVVSFLAAHPPLIPPQFYFDRYYRAGLITPAVGEWAVPPENDGVGHSVSGRKVHLYGERLKAMTAGYFGLINHMDDQIRRLLNPVDGIHAATDDNTVILFLADHGEMLGDHYYWGKALPYQGSIHIPFMLYTPKHMGFRRSTELQQAVCLEDVMPTLLDLAEIPSPAHVEGKSVVGLLEGRQNLEREAIHIECASGFQALTDGTMKYIWFTETGAEQLFDLHQDSHECRNLVSDSRYQEQLSVWRERMIRKLAGRPEGFTDGERLITPGSTSPRQ